MKRTRMERVFLVVLACMPARLLLAGPVSTVFTYQGRINLNGVPLDDAADFEFRLFDMAAGGNQIGQTVTAGNVQVTDGLFSVPVDFGVDLLDIGFLPFLEIAVRSPAGAGTFEVLSPRQELTAAPFATTAMQVALPLAQTMNVVGDAFSVTNDSAVPAGPEGGGSSALRGKSANGSAVFGDTSNGIGVFGRSTGTNGIGVKASADGMQPALLATSTGFAGAARFEFNRGQPNVQPAVELLTNTDGVALNVRNTGMGTGVSVGLESAQNTSTALNVSNFGAGTSINVRHRGAGGRAGDFLNSPLTPNQNASEAIRARTESTGRAAVFEIDTLLSQATNTTEALLAKTDADGGAARFEITNTLSPGPPGAQPVSTVYAENRGLGRAGTFVVTGANPNNQSDALAAIASNLRHVLFAQQVGVGESAHFEILNPLNPSNVVFMGHNGQGDMLLMRHTGAGGGMLFDANHANGRIAFLVGRDAGATSPALTIQNAGTNTTLLVQGGPVTLPVTNTGPLTVTGNAQVNGNLNVTGTLTKGAGMFKIDHPLDPANKYLLHSFVESSEMKNVYDGTVLLDARGQAVVELPDWFEVLNRDLRYQLTAIGEPGPDLHIAHKVEGGRFTIAGGKPGMEVCWQVTGVRQDVYARAHPLRVEVEKPEQERGKYMHPDVFGQPTELGLHYETRRLSEEMNAAVAAEIEARKLKTCPTQPWDGLGGAPLVAEDEEHE